MAGTATVLGAGAVLDDIRVGAGRDKVFVPFMSSLGFAGYKQVFGEVNNAGVDKFTAMTKEAKLTLDPKVTPTETVNSVSAAIDKYESLDAAGKAEFLNKIKESVSKEK